MTESKDEFINGQILVSFRDYIKKKFGANGLSQMNDALSFDIMQVTDEKDYPSSHAVECMDYIQKRYGPDALYQMGRFSLQNIGAKRYFTLFMPPNKLLDKLVESVPKVNNTVKIHVDYKEKGAIVRLSNPDFKEVHCKYWHGMLQGVFDLTKTKGRIEVDISKLETEKQIYFTMHW